MLAQLLRKKMLPFRQYAPRIAILKIWQKADLCWLDDNAQVGLCAKVGSDSVLGNG